MPERCFRSSSLSRKAGQKAYRMVRCSSQRLWVLYSRTLQNSCKVHSGWEQYIQAASMCMLARARAGRLCACAGTLGANTHRL